MDGTDQRKAVLLIEDDPALRDSLRRWFTVMFPDIQLTEATDCAQGLSVSRGMPPDVVLMDISCLGREAVQAVRRMSEAQPAAAIIALVAYDHQLYRQEVLASGAEASVSVWRVPKELLPRLERALSARSASEKRISRSTGRAP